MRILVAAYACEPGRGSEPLVGWRWVHEIQSLGHDVWVMTRANNQPVIEQHEDSHGASGVRFVYIDLPAPFKLLKKVPGGIYPYYYAWQILALIHAFKLHRGYRFERIHQLTFVSIRFPTLLGLLGVPLWVNVGGGERSPKQLRQPLGLKFWLREGLRDLLLYLHALDPLRALGFTLAERILTTTHESTDALPFWVRKRCEVFPAIACDQPAPTVERDLQPDSIELLYAGLHKDWKGLRLGLRALAAARRRSDRSFHLTIVGRGPDHHLWRAEVDGLGLSDAVTFVEWMPREQLLEYYGRKHAFLYPSLHDSGGLVVWEALAAGLPVVCLACGGPGLIVTSACGWVQDVDGMSYQQVLEGLTEGLLKLAAPDQVATWSAGARARAGAMTWASLVRSVYASKAGSRA